ncbi:MAG: sugar phosphate nucleotidyltransferase [Acutalibacteraceae bacterium]|nr:sugar phosphate nucleotidyltransferase [Acutalibacteraceae bacterium]
MSKAILVVMAAGLGSRFGSAKQLEPIGPNGEILLDYSVQDAVKAGFDKVIFVIRAEHETAFREHIGDRIAKQVDVEYVFQTMDNLPEDRKKPWGTGHAILCCKNAVDAPFAVINADDYYGVEAYQLLFDHLVKAKGSEFCMVGFLLKNTVSEYGAVSRGICEIKNGLLDKVTEHFKISNDLTSLMPDGSVIQLPDSTICSMNMWGFTTEIFPALEKGYKDFLNTANLSKDEFFLPFVVDDMVQNKTATVNVYESADKWYGMTYREDIPNVKAALKELTDKGIYK